MKNEFCRKFYIKNVRNVEGLYHFNLFMAFTEGLFSLICNKLAVGKFNNLAIRVVKYTAIAPELRHFAPELRHLRQDLRSGFPQWL